MVIDIYDIELFKAVLTAAAIEDVRFYLKGVLFTKGGFVVGTDGHRLVKVKCANYEGEDVILNPGKKVPPKACFIEIDTESLLVRYLSSTREEISLGRAEKIDHKYPDYARAIPELSKEAGPSVYSFNPALIADIQKAGKFKGFKFNVTGDEKPIRFTPYKLEDEKFIGVMMPMRL